MGSFTELNLAFAFADETPIEVVGAFRDWRIGEDAPELPALEESMSADPFDADAFLADQFGEDPMASLSQLQRAAVWRYLVGWPANAYFPGTPATALRWEPYARHWTLTSRTLPKEAGDAVRSIVAPLGEWAADGSPDRPRFVGYLLDEESSRPVLIWSAGRQPFHFEGDFDAA